MKPRFRSLAARVAPFAGVVFFCSFQSLQAASGVWTGTTSGGNWSDTANWSGGTVADGSGSLADFTTLDLPAGAFTVNLDSARTIGSLSFNDTDGATAGTWTVSGANTLTLAGTPVITTGVNATISSVVAGTSGFGKSGSANLILTNANTISGAISVSAGQLTTKNGGALGTSTLALANGAIYRFERTTGNVFTFVGNAISVGSAATAIITSDNAGNGCFGAISGAANASFQIGNTGALTQVSLSANNNVRQFENFAGTVEIFDGASVRFSASNTLNNGGLDATFDTNTSGTITTRNNGTMNLGALTGNGTVTMGSSGSNNAWLTYNIGAKGTDTTYGGRILDGDTVNGKRVAINKVGAGSLKLTSATDLTYSGTTNVNEGTLIVNGAKSGTGANNINVNGTLSGSGSLAGTTTVANGGTLEPGDAGSGNLTLANATFATGSTIKLGATPSTNKVVIGTGSTITLNSGISVDVNGFNTDGTYQIITTTGATLSGSPSASLTATNADPGKV
jgi:autotransporter-associated beta strand protein